MVFKEGYVRAYRDARPCVSTSHKTAFTVNLQFFHFQILGFWNIFNDKIMGFWNKTYFYFWGFWKIWYFCTRKIGSLISIRKNTKDIIIPSEETRIKVFRLQNPQIARWVLPQIFRTHSHTPPHLHQRLWKGWYHHIAPRHDDNVFVRRVWHFFLPPNNRPEVLGLNKFRCAKTIFLTVGNHVRRARAKVLYVASQEQRMRNYRIRGFRWVQKSQMQKYTIYFTPAGTIFRYRFRFGSRPLNSWTLNFEL